MHAGVRGLCINTNNETFPPTLIGESSLRKTRSKETVKATIRVTACSQYIVLTL